MMDVTWHNSNICKPLRREMNGHKSAVIWFTGLSGSGKSTLAFELERLLFINGIRSYVLDGDNIRHGLNNNLGFSPEDRKENIRRIGEVSKLFVEAGLFCITAFISPYEEDRLTVRKLLDDDEFIEVYLDCPLNECERRDPKGLYTKARSGAIPNFTGISAPYECPEKPEITLKTAEQSMEKSVQQVFSYLERHHYI